MAAQRIRIRLKAYDFRVIDQSAREIADTVKRTGARVAGPTESACRTVLAREARTFSARGARCRTGHIPSLAKACPARYTEIQRKLSSCHLPKHLLAKKQSALG